MKILVPVKFEGVVEVDVSDNMPQDLNPQLLAEKLAVSRVLATCDNPDAPDDDAFNDYVNELLGETSDLPQAEFVLESYWDSSVCSVSGTWEGGKGIC